MSNPQYKLAKAEIRRRHLPSHAVLRSFECAARHESFTLAAEELHLTQSAISRQVKELESLLGFELFRRIGRNVVLTDAGRNLAGELAIDLENIHQTVMRAVSAGDIGTALRIATLPTFASRWLIPRLPEFTRQYPEIEINLYTRLSPFDLTREHFDLAIHFGTDDWPRTEMQILCSERMIAVASPAFKARHNIIDAGELMRLPLLHLESRPLIWQDFFKAANLAETPRLRGKYFDQFSMIIAAARASLGAALLPTYLIEQELEDGSLSPLSPVEVSTRNSY
ncbi:MAG: LysR family transcriptional regulator, partial [Alphaproteobacteria bacterium]